MGDQDDFDVSNLLKRIGLILAPHLVNILKDLRYNNLRTLVQVEEAELFQDAVIESFGVNQEYLDLTDEQKKTLLGPKVVDKDAPSIPNSEAQQTSLKNSMRTAGPIPLHTASLTTAKNETVYVTKNEIEAHVNDCCSKRGNLMYSPEDFHVKNSNVLYCKLCHHGYKFILGVNGYWKATIFLQHISSKQSPSNSDQVCLPKKRSVTANETGMDAMKNPMVTINQPLSSDESDQENDPHDSQDESKANDKNKNYGSSSNDESTEESRKINDSGDEELAKEKEASKKKNCDKNKKFANCRPVCI
ncbi:Uncharacterized protein APZ42_027773 [Daphnia magna]|uniref:Uncharacterized protein n=1 Tax=Daphnia magna TaxID=35525 RepID=A0A164R345_9CRUS|nr:Uncharacterized protein APZ42_027773 [Daphnia magna]